LSARLGFQVRSWIPLPHRSPAVVPAERGSRSKGRQFETHYLADVRMFQQPSRFF